MNFRKAVNDMAQSSMYSLSKEQLINKLEQLQVENEKLKEFVRPFIQEICWSFEIDGGSLQDTAEDLGLIKGCTVTEDDVDDYPDFEVGDTIFKFTF